jgi:hypothetical protein
MKPSRLEAVLQHLVKLRWPAFVWGPPGIGKSSVVRKVAAAEQLALRDVRASLLDPTDLRGIPTVDQGRAVWCPPAFLPREDEPAGILFLDEINAAPPLVQAALYQLVLDRQIGEYRLPEGWRIIAAGNRQEDRAVVFRLSSALANRFVHLNFDIDFEDWRRWAAGQRVHPWVVGLLALRPELLSTPPADAPAYATPRSWEMLSDVLLATGSVEDCADILPGIVGEGAAAEFLGFARQSLREEDFLAIVESPADAKLPTGLGEVYALTAWLSYRAADRQTRRAAAVLLNRLEPEFAVVLARAMMAESLEILKEPGYREFMQRHAKLIAG